MHAFEIFNNIKKKQLNSNLKTTFLNTLHRYSNIHGVVLLHKYLLKSNYMSNGNTWKYPDFFFVAQS